jgi:hypothetical protein
MAASATHIVPLDTHAQLRALYTALCTKQEHFDEFKQLLNLYVVEDWSKGEPDEATRIRVTLNERIREWVGDQFEGLSPTQIMLWRAIVVESRTNVALSPWAESNGY